MIRKLTLSLVIATSVSMFALPSYGQISSIGELLDNTDNLPVRGVPSGFSKLAKQLSPSVVNISTAQTVEVNTDDEILMVNQSFQDLSGYTEEELIGKKGMEMLLTEEGQARLSAENKNRLKGQSNSYEVQGRTKKGALRHWLISGAPNYNLNGKIIGSIGIHLDITELKNLEIQKENLLVKLEKSNDALQEYAHVVSHDLKSPLRSINALVNWIKEDNKDTLTKDSQEHLELVEETLEKMEQLISDVLEYSSVGASNLISERVDLNEVLRDIETLLHCPEHIVLQINRGLPSVRGDKVKIQQLFQNLMSNAIRYCDKDQGLVIVNYTENTNFYTFSVKDNGIGIAEEYHDKIFKMFQSLNNHKESTGIGLSIVKKIVDLYGGDIWLESKEEVGTAFYFTLPKEI